MSKPLLAMINPPAQEAVESQSLALATAIAFLNLSSGPDPAVGSARDLPPKYETLEADLTAPPEYDEAVLCGHDVHVPQPVGHYEDGRANHIYVSSRLH